MKLKYITPRWSCPYCTKPVGILGNLLAKGFGTKIHDCDFSNVMSSEEIKDQRELEYVMTFLKEIEKETEEYWQKSSVNSEMDELILKLSIIHESLKIFIIPKMEKALHSDD